MSLQAGIVGLPNVGKSTLFNALTSAGAESANYPFCTIEPNVGIVPVPDDRLEELNSLMTTEKTVPALVEIVDIAGLVRGASKGEGLGNQFLGHIRAVDAVLHVVRCFESTDIVHVDDTVDPIRDIETIHTELILADLDSVEKRIRRLEKLARSNNKEAAFDLAVTQKISKVLDSGRLVQMARGEFSDDEWVSVGDAQLITTLPFMMVCNVDEEGAAEGNAFVEQVRAYAKENGMGCIFLCAQVESEIAELDKEERDAFLEDLGIKEPGLSTLARATYDLLGLETYFTAGPKEIRAWTIHRGDSAPVAAGKIHTDFQKGFIRAEVYTLDDLKTYKNEAGLKAAGKLRVEGKEYIVKDGDILHFRFNV